MLFKLFLYNITIIIVGAKHFIIDKSRADWPFRLSANKCNSSPNVLSLSLSGTLSCSTEHG